MKKIFVFVINFCTFSALAQIQPLNDTLLPESPLIDTIQPEPKLEGGALIDTVNIKKQPRPFKSHDPILKDSNIVKPRKEY